MRKATLIILILLAALFPGTASAAGLDVKPITWDVIGLESSAPKIPTGPNLYPVGAEICNSSGNGINDLESELVWDSANSYIEVDGPSTDAIGSLAVGECIDTLFVVQVEKVEAAWNTARAYHIEANATGASGSTPLGRQLYVERLVGQNRNSTQAISGSGGCNADFSVCDPAPTSLQVGEEYTYKLYSETSAPHNQVTSFITFPGSIFQVERVKSTYEFPAGAEVDGPYADACGWQPDPALPNYLSCTGPIPTQFQPDGKAGGRMVTTYTVLIIGEGSGTLTSLINDHSGSSYHYNNDYGDVQIDFTSEYPLDVQVNGFGTVVSSPSGIECGMSFTNCLKTYPEGEEVILTATPEPGQSFLGWGGACADAGMSLTCTLLMSEARSAVANFSGDTFYPLVVEVTTGGRATSDVGGIDCPAVLCTKSYLAGSQVALDPEPLPGYRFVGWEGDCTATSDPCNITMDGPRYARAIFEAEEPNFYTLLFKYNERGEVQSSSVPDRTGQIDCGIECLATYPEGTRVTLVAKPVPGWRIVSWGDDCTGTPIEENCVLDMTEDRVSSAQYEEIRWPLGVAIKGQGNVQGSSILCPTTCNGDYSDGTQIKLNAEPEPGWKFSGWEGDCIPSGVECSATMDQARDVVARFVLNDPKLKINIDIFKRKIYRGSYFKGKLTFRNVNKDTALSARPCLFLPSGVRVIQADSGVVKKGRICWQKKDLGAGEGRRYDLQFRALRTGKKKFSARGYADNAPSVRDNDSIRVIRRPAPHPPTG